MNHLRLVGSPEPMKPPRKRRKWERSPLLTPDEEKRFRQAMKNLRDAFGTWGALAAAMGTKPKIVGAMMRGEHHVSGDLIVRAMRASGLSLADLLGGPVPADRCRACGRVRAA